MSDAETLALIAEWWKQQKEVKWGRDAFSSIGSWYQGDPLPTQMLVFRSTSLREFQITTHSIATVCHQRGIPCDALLSVVRAATIEPRTGYATISELAHREIEVPIVKLELLLKVIATDSDTGTDGVGDEQHENGEPSPKRLGKWAAVHLLLDNEPDADVWDNEKRRRKVHDWNIAYAATNWNQLTVPKLGELIRSRRKRPSDDD